FCGIVTDRDIVVRALAEGKDGDASLESVCSKDITALRTDSTDEDAIRLMREKSIRRLPVLENGKIVGIVSLGDLAIAKDPHSVRCQAAKPPSGRELPPADNTTSGSERASCRPPHGRTEPYQTFQSWNPERSSTPGADWSVVL